MAIANRRSGSSPTTTARPTISRSSVHSRLPPGSRIEFIGAVSHAYALPPVMNQSLWRHADFMKLWTGQTVSSLGSVVTRTAVPLVAVLLLSAGPTEIALVIVSQSLAVLLVGFFAGAWVDRVRRRPVLITADAMRAVLLFTIPAAYF